MTYKGQKKGGKKAELVSGELTAGRKELAQTA